MPDNPMTTEGVKRDALLARPFYARNDLRAYFGFIAGVLTIYRTAPTAKQVCQIKLPWHRPVIWLRKWRVRRVLKLNGYTP